VSPDLTSLGSEIPAKRLTYEVAVRKPPSVAVPVPVKSCGDV
jgi:hypothetical protein